MLEKVEWYFGLTEPKKGKSYYSLKAVKNAKGVISLEDYQIPHLLSYECIFNSCDKQYFLLHTKNRDFIVTFYGKRWYDPIILATKEPVLGEYFYGYTLKNRYGKFFLDEYVTREVIKITEPAKKENPNLSKNLFICTTADYNKYIVEVV